MKKDKNIILIFLASITIMKFSVCINILLVAKLMSIACFYASCLVMDKSENTRIHLNGYLRSKTSEVSLAYEIFMMRKLKNDIQME